ncbi:MAG TPA: DUF1146 family protein [Lapidilactobacillus dextrinicus]|jgi:uncharacterized integral membrane protein (TIGR02327 family)|uniref:DUF1146 domain-containing protein n=2 Tax=Lapidilactobacillus dextrinicus TaxID=51664 RepID=A0A0R2BKK0_9LACO|nr:DUF1146 family protein [Lapidilactobacillus dextrinicus]KRM79863.1 hypothetical protein FC84_GL000560 [Lapidilactobacillus dextrinicus DSM 20335]QFG46353.1 DUF1146 domain-containing protein [Lapidilactobacillus dextrinicus]HJE14515.1 DUF1146 family protein [Lapidilactobacillus dextrinicus]
MNSVNLQALFTILSHLFFVYLAYSALSVVRFDVFFHSHQENKTRILKLFLAIALGYTVSSFLLAVITSLQNVLFSY